MRSGRPARSLSLPMVSLSLFVVSLRGFGFSHTIEPAMSSASEPLIKDDANLHASSVYFNNFLMMCCVFSVNHGCVTSCLAYASTELGPDLAGLGGGILYVFYACTSLFFSNVIVSMVGAKKGLILGLGGYCLYVGAFLFAILSDRMKETSTTLTYIIFSTACALGGFSGGLLWTAQGRYFAKNAKLYSDALLNELSDASMSSALEIGTNPLNTDKDGDTAEAQINTASIEKVNSSFGGIFALNYLGFETLTKGGATIIFLLAPDEATSIIFSTYAILSVISVVCMIFYCLTLDDMGSGDFSWSAAYNRAVDAGRLVLSDYVLAMLLPFSIAFGFASSFVPYYVLGVIVNDSAELGKTYVGLLSAIITLVGAAAAIPIAKISNIESIGKAPNMIFGCVCLAFGGFICYFLSDALLGTWGWIIFYLFIYGLGRGVFENTNKAVVADIYSKSNQHITSAYASVAFASGFSGAIGYFTFSHSTRDAMITLVFVSACVAMGTYIASHIAHKKRDGFFEF